MINVLADKHLVNICKFMPPGVNLELYDPSTFDNTLPNDVDAFLIRTVTKINPQTFSTFPEQLRFIGTGSAGTDHVDIPHLQKNGITFADAAGCNARSVAEYVAVALLLWAEETGVRLQDFTVGIVGVGHAGGEVNKLLHALGVPTVTYDPPREERDRDFTSATREDVLACPILTFHIPLTKTGNYPTRHWLNQKVLAEKSFKLVINAARGGVIDEHALLQAHKNQTVENYILDVWENEPVFDDAVARNAFIKTPHIAGYSVQAKNRSSRMIADAMASHFEIEEQQSNLEKTEKGSAQRTPPEFWSLTDALTFYHPIRDYETRFKMLIGRAAEGKSTGFSRIRTGQPLRNEFNYLHIPGTVIKKFPTLEKLLK